MAIALTPKGAFAFNGAFGNSPQTITGAALGTGDILVFTWGDFGSPGSVTVDGVTATSLGATANANGQAWLATGITNATGNIALGATLNFVGANWWLITGEAASPTFTSSATNAVSGTVPASGVGVSAAFDTVGGSTNRNPATWTGVTGSTTVEAQDLTGNGLNASGGSTTSSGALTATATAYLDTVDSMLLTFSAAAGGDTLFVGGGIHFI
jgi:hypothetical protein